MIKKDDLKPSNSSIMDQLLVGISFQRQEHQEVFDHSARITVGEEKEYHCPHHLPNLLQRHLPHS
jgi:hypothetical protein